MKEQTYWTFDQRYPLITGETTLKNRAMRFFDRLDDVWMACLANVEFNRIQRAH